MAETVEKRLFIRSVDEVRRLFGERDTHIKLIEDAVNVTMVTRESEVVINGEAEQVELAEQALRQLLSLIRAGQNIEERDVQYAIRMTIDHEDIDLLSLADDEVVLTAKGKVVRPKTKGQQGYVEAMRHNTLVFGIGPAGTGKTYLAIAMAVAALRKREVGRIILTRPAVEAGERLGFLPGDLQAKIDPYLRPLYDALYDIVGAEQFLKYLEKGIIEVAPLAYMRGRTLDNSFVILDEAQNTTQTQMKMFLTRLGFGSQAVVTGDVTQTDLPRGQSSGLKQAASILKSIDDISIVYLTEKDVVRHALVQKIIKAYEKSDRSRNRRG